MERNFNSSIEESFYQGGKEYLTHYIKTEGKKEALKKFEEKTNEVKIVTEAYLKEASSVSEDDIKSMINDFSEAEGQLSDEDATVLYNDILKKREEMKLFTEERVNELCDFIIEDCSDVEHDPESVIDDHERENLGW